MITAQTNNDFIKILCLVTDALITKFCFFSLRRMLHIFVSHRLGWGTDSYCILLS